MKKIKGFTLAEVLITLSILGVVAAIMIPNTIQKISDRQTVTAVKRAYSLLDNALQALYAEEGDPNTWNWPTRTTNQILAPDTASDNVSKKANTDFLTEKLLRYISAAQVCGNAKGCFPETDLKDGWDRSLYKTLKNNKGEQTDVTGIPGKTIAKNGMLFNTSVFYKRDMGGVFGIFRVDVNGKKGPNRYGYDVFFFPFNKYGIMSNSTPRDTNNGDYYQFFFQQAYCNKYNSITENRDGQSCYTWIIKHNNMDYKYRDVSAEW